MMPKYKIRQETMKIEVQHLSNEPDCSTLQVFEQGSLRPFCLVWEDDFAELLGPKQREQFYNEMRYQFDLSKTAIIQASYLH